MPLWLRFTEAVCICEVVCLCVVLICVQIWMDAYIFQYLLHLKSHVHIITVLSAELDI